MQKGVGNTELLILVIIGAIFFWFFISKSNEPTYYFNEESGLTSYTTEKRKNWALFLYVSDYPDTDYQKDAIFGLASQKTCISEGIKRTVSSGSFECGYKCKTQYYTLEDYSDQVDICEKICNESGCRD